MYIAYDENERPFLGVFKTRESALSAIEEYVEETRDILPNFNDEFCYVEEVNYYDF
jgi:hypothetical protein